jgi:hypothetical protein
VRYDASGRRHQFKAELHRLQRAAHLMRHLPQARQQLAGVVSAPRFAEQFQRRSKVADNNDQTSVGGRRLVETADG